MLTQPFSVLAAYAKKLDVHFFIRKKCFGRRCNNPTFYCACRCIAVSLILATNSVFSSHVFQDISKLDIGTDTEVFSDALDNFVSNRLLNLCIDFQNEIYEINVAPMRTGKFAFST